MRFYLINEHGNKVIDIPNKYDDIKQVLGYNGWDSIAITIGGEGFICVCNDLGKLLHLPVSALSFNNLLSSKKTIQEPFLVGPILIAKFNGVDDFEGLNDDDIDNIEGSILSVGKTGNDFYKKVLILD